jgi:outer membrane protein assembly factor BamB
VFSLSTSSILLVKFDVAGTVVWQRAWDDAIGRPEAAGVAAAPDGSVYVAGRASINRGDAVLLKFSGDGELLWQQAWGGSNTTEGAEAVAVAPDGSVYLAGFTSVPETGEGRLVVVKFAPGDRSVIWQKTTASPSSARGIAVEEGPGGHIYVAGGIASADPNIGGEVLLLKIDPAGAIVWQRSYAAAPEDTPSL